MGIIDRLFRKKDKKSEPTQVEDRARLGVPSDRREPPEVAVFVKSSVRGKYQTVTDLGNGEYEIRFHESIRPDQRILQIFGRHEFRTILSDQRLQFIGVIGRQGDYEDLLDDLNASREVIQDFRTLMEQLSQLTAHHDERTEECSKCGKSGARMTAGGDIVVTVKEQMRSMIMECRACGRPFCGECAEAPGEGGVTFYNCPQCGRSLAPFET
jgi:hypothetical protein